MQNLLYVIPGAQPEVWVICGEFDDSENLPVRRKIYMYFILPLRMPFLRVLIMAHFKALKRRR